MMDVMDAYAIIVGPVWIMVPQLPNPLAVLALAGIGAIIWRIKRREKRTGVREI